MLRSLAGSLRYNEPAFFMRIWVDFHSQHNGCYPSLQKFSDCRRISVGDAVTMFDSDNVTLPGRVVAIQGEVVWILPIAQQQGEGDG